MSPGIDSLCIGQTADELGPRRGLRLPSLVPPHPLSITWNMHSQGPTRDKTVNDVCSTVETKIITSKLPIIQN
eukprot:1382984-Amphidinium_carterae.1